MNRLQHRVRFYLETMQKTGEMPTVREPLIREAFRMVSRMEAGQSLETTPQRRVKTEEVTRSREGWIGGLVDRLVGPRREERTRVWYEVPYGYRDMKLVDLVLNKKSELEIDEIQSMKQQNPSGV